MPKAGVVIAVDGERQFTQAMRTAKTEALAMKSKLQEVQAQFANNANSMEALTAKQKALIEAQEAYQKELEAAKAGQENARAAVEKWQSAVEASSTALKDAKARQEELRKAGKEGTEEYQKQEKAVKELEDQLEKESKALQTAYKSEQKYTKEATSAQKELNSLNDELRDTDRYLDEAKSSADGCATSIDQFGKEVKETGESADSMGSSFKAVFTGTLAADAMKAIAGKAAELGKALANVTIEASKYADDILSMSAVTGMSTDRLQEFAYAAELIDTSLETVTGALAKNVKSMYSAENGSKTYKEAYEKLGVSIEDANGNLRNSEDVFWDAIDALGKVENQTEADAIAMQLFGKSAADLKPLIAQGSEGFEALAKEAKDTGAVLDSESIGKLGEVNDAYVRFTNSVDALKNNTGARLAEYVTPILEQLTNLINGITSLINPAKSELEQFISDTRNMHEDVQDLVKGAEKAVSDGQDEVAKLDVTADKVKNVLAQLGAFKEYDASPVASNVSTAAKGIEDAIGPMADSIKDAKDAISEFGKTEVSVPDKKQAELLNEWGQLGYGGIAAIIKGTQNDIDDFKSTTVSVPDDQQTEILNKWGEKGFGGISAIIAETGSAVSGFGETEVTVPDASGVETVEKPYDDAKSAAEDAAKSITDFGNTEAGAPDMSAVEGALTGTETEITETQNLLDQLDSWEAQQLKGNMQYLISMVPEFAAAWDETTGHLRMTEEEFDSLIEKARALTMSKALNSATEMALEGYAKSLVEQERAAAAVKAAQEEYNKALEEAPLVETKDRAGKYSAELERAEKALGDAKQAQADANKDTEQAQQILESTEEAVSNLQREYGVLGETLEDQSIAGAVEIPEDIAEAWENMRDSIADAISDSISLINEFTGGEQKSADEILAALDSQIKGLNNWVENMQTLGQLAGSGMSQELYDALAEMGPEAANIVQELVDTLNKEPEKFQEISNKYAEALKISDTAALVASYTTAGKESGDAFSGEIEAAKQAATESAASMASDTADELDPSENDVEGKGEETAEEYSGGIENSASEAETAARTMAEDAVTAAESGSSGITQVGYDFASGMAQGIRNGENLAVNAARDLVKAAVEAARSEEDAHSPAKIPKKKIGLPWAQGVAEGINEGSEIVEGASKKVIKAAISAAEKEMESASVAKKLQKQINNMFGVSKTDDKGKTKSASKYAADVLDAAEQFLKNYQTLHHMTEAEELKYWQSVQKTLKKGSQAWYDAQSEINSLQESIFKAQLSTEKKAAEDRKKEREAAKKEEASSQSKALDSLETYMDRQKILRDVSAEEEKAYWETHLSDFKKKSDEYYAVLDKLNRLNETIRNEEAAAAAKELADAEKEIEREKLVRTVTISEELDFWKRRLAITKTGTDEYFEILRKVNDLEAAQRAEQEAAAQAAVDAERERLAQLVNVQSKILSAYKTYYKTSNKAEMQYWAIARQQFAAGTNERLDADQKYLAAKEAWYKELTDLDKDYQERTAEINKDLADKVDELTQTYKDAVSERKQAILSSFDLFSAWDNEGYTAEAMLHNAKTQVEGLKLWEQEITALRNKHLPEELMQQLEEMGPEATANIYTLNRMTALELGEWVRMWETKNAIANRQAKEQTEDLLTETQRGVAAARQEAAEELTKLNSEYQSELAKINQGIDSGLSGLINRAETIGEDTVAALVDGIRTGESSISESMQQLLNAAASRALAEKAALAIYNNAGIGSSIGAINNLTAGNAASPMITVDNSGSNVLLNGILAAVQGINRALQSDGGSGAGIRTEDILQALAPAIGNVLAETAVRGNGGMLI